MTDQRADDRVDAMRYFFASVPQRPVIQWTNLNPPDKYPEIGMDIGIWDCRTSQAMRRRFKKPSTSYQRRRARRPNLYPRKLTLLDFYLQYVLPQLQQPLTASAFNHLGERGLREIAFSLPPRSQGKSEAARAMFAGRDGIVELTGDGSTRSLSEMVPVFDEAGDISALDMEAIHYRLEQTFERDMVEAIFGRGPLRMMVLPRWQEHGMTLQAATHVENAWCAKAGCRPLEEVSGK